MPLPDTTDWLGFCRRAAGAARDAVHGYATTAERAVETGRGEGGDTAYVIDATDPKRSIQARITRMTGELETRTRTMQIEVNIDNSEGFLAAGSFAYVRLHIPIQSYPQIPVSGLLVRGAETMVATVENDTLRYKPIKVASTDGNTVTVAEGLRQGDRVAINLPDEVQNGSKVQPVQVQRR